MKRIFYLCACLCVRVLNEELMLVSAGVFGRAVFPAARDCCCEICRVHTETGEIDNKHIFNSTVDTY